MPDEIVAKELAHDTKDGTIARLAQANRKLKGLFKQSTVERNTARTELAKAAADLVEARKSGTAVEELAALKLKVKADGHRAKFNELATAAGAKPKALDDLWHHSGYKADGDLPDEKGMSKLIEAQREQRDWLFDGDGTTETEKPAVGFIDGPPEPGAGAEHIVKPAAGRGQGGTQRATGSQTQITDAQLRDPVWCRANQAKLAAVAATVAGMTKNEVGSKLAILG